MARSTFVELTVPIRVNDVELGEFDIEVEVNVTSFGHPSTYWDPPEPPEWEIGDIFLCRCGPEDEDGKRADVDCPVELTPFVDEYLDSNDATDAICEAIDKMEMD